jgi:hypothetical protein
MTAELEILDALDQQLACYRRLAKLAEIQHEHVQRNHTEGLLEVLGMRQEVLEELSRHEATAAAAKKDWQGFIAGLDDASRGRAETSMAQTRALLEQIVAADRQDTMILQQRKLSLGQQIHQAQAARQVNRSIAASAYGKQQAAGALNVRR